MQVGCTAVEQREIDVLLRHLQSSNNDVRDSTLQVNLILNFTNSWAKSVTKFSNDFVLAF